MTLAELADEGLDRDVYVPPFGKGSLPGAPAAAPVAPGGVVLPCRPGEYHLPENWVWCGPPAQPAVSVAPAPPRRWGGGGGGGETPAPVPLPAAGWLLVAACAVLWRRAR